ncbi:beta-lactamase family protein [Clostridiales bacterium FE2011]|nr:beta-lactamase family protein [Clostridiales bacterium FE2011]QTE75777.1 beta-lactamase family protein [Clostridiales bacterium FE2010]
MDQKLFHGVDIGSILGIRKIKRYGASIAVANGDSIETFCLGTGRFGKNFPVNSDMLFQAGSVSKPVFAATLLRYVDKGIIDLDADISGVISDFVDFPLTFSALLSHTAGFNVHGFPGYRARHRLLSLEDVLNGSGNTPKVCRTMPYGEQYSYSGGGITLAELAFTRITGTTLQDAFAQEVAAPLGLTRSGYFQPLDEGMIENAAFGGQLGIWEDHSHGYHYYPEHAAAGLWATPNELVKIGIALSRSFREGTFLSKETAVRMMTPVMNNYGLCVECNTDSAHHMGVNAGFITFLKFSLTEDYCVAVMTNKFGITGTKMIGKVSEAGEQLFIHAKG